MYIVEATSSENRTTHGSMGDQTGREICVSNFYSYPWDVVLYCKDDTLRRKAAQIAQEIASNPSFGYSQPNRWTGYNSIVSNGGKVAGARGDFDCSSLVISCYALAGLAIPTGIGYTGTIEQTFLSTGKFEALRGQHTLDYMRGAIGCIYLNTANHTAIGITDEGLRPRPQSPKILFSKFSKPAPIFSKVQPKKSTYKWKGKENFAIQLYFLPHLLYLAIYLCLTSCSVRLYPKANPFWDQFRLEIQEKHIRLLLSFFSPLFVSPI